MKNELKIKLVILEPSLEEFAGDLNAEQCEALARRQYRFAKALWVKAAVLRLHDPRSPKPVKRKRARFWRGC